MSQSDSLDLRTYDNPDFHIHRLSFTPFLNQNYTGSEQLRRNDIRSSVVVDYGFDFNTESHVRNFQVTLFPTYQFDKINDQRSTNGNLFSFSLNASNTNRSYWGKKWHILYNYDQDFISRNRYEEERVYSYASRFSFGLGWGNPQLITYAWKAITIIDDLHRLGVEAKRENLHAFADALAINQQRRILDNRLAFIERIGTVYQYLEQHHLESFSPVAAALIQDSWVNEATRQRFNGELIQFYAGPNWSGSKILDQNLSINNSIIVGLKAERFLPINKNWQFDNSFGLTLARNFRPAEAIQFTDFISSEYRLDLKHTLVWYPSQRINNIVQLDLKYRRFNFNSADPSNTYDYTLSESLNYYFSRRFTMSVQFFLSLNSSEFLSDYIVSQGLQIRAFYFIL